MKIITVVVWMVSLALILNCSPNHSSQVWQTQSPDGRIVLSVKLNDAIKADNQSLSFSVACAGKTVIDASPLGLERNDASFRNDLKFLSRTDQKIDETYVLHNGKRSTCHAQAMQTTLSFANAKGAKLDVIFRVYDDGIGLKYRFPEEDAQTYSIIREFTGFAIPKGTAYIMPYDNPGQWVPAYENYYTEHQVGDSSPTKAGWAMPALFKINEGKNWLLIAESGLNGSYCGTRFEQDAPGGLYRIRFPEAEDGNGIGSVQPSSTLPWETSWKAVIIAETAGGIIESSLITNLADAPAFPVGEYIKPGRAAWSWWSDSNSPRNFQRQRAFIDLAATMGWEYYLVDANWNFEPTADLLDFIHYAQSKHVGVWLWYNSGGPHNIVTEAPRDRFYDKTRRLQELQWLKEIGVKGVKVDFWHSDKQETIQYYIDLMKDANDFGILINFHGCTVPRGWERTYPNMLALESVRGAESYKFAPEYPSRAVLHNVCLAFTRNVIGPMDYTPVTFSDMENPHLTTNAHELALSVVFQSGLLHPADKPESYLAQPPEVQTFLKNVPVTWDETVCLAGDPSSFVIIARRHGDDWYIGGISGAAEKISLNLDLSQLLKGEVDIQWIGDGENARSFATGALSGVHHDITFAPYGGMVMRVTPKE